MNFIEKELKDLLKQTPFLTKNEIKMFSIAFKTGAVTGTNELARLLSEQNDENTDKYLNELTELYNELIKK